MLLVAILQAGGCGAARTASHTWVRDMGGKSPDQPLARQAQQALKRALPTAADLSVSVYVLDSDALEAYAWPSGSIYVTAGLVRCCSDEEITAAIAHEIGHLIAERDIDWPAALRGSSEGDEETQADLTGCRVLAAAGIPPQAMIGMLRKLCEADVCRRDAIMERIAAIERMHHTAASID